MPDPTPSFITFSPIHTQKPGIVLSLLENSYRTFLESIPELWAQERAEWAELDRLAFSLQGNWIFLTRKAGEIIGLASFDPRGFPLAVVGHNCILPAFRGNGYGKLQLRELIRVIRERRFTKVRVSTGDHDYFIPAQRMYVSCGFKEVRRGVPPPRPFGSSTEIEYQLELDNN